jgi:hypothetical protein
MQQLCQSPTEAARRSVATVRRFVTAWKKDIQRQELVSGQRRAGGGAPSAPFSPLIGVVSWLKLESVGGRAHESQCIRFVWNGGGAAYRNGGADAFPRYAFRERDWHLKVLRYQRRNRKTVRSTSTHRTNDRAPCGTKLENTTTTVAASQNKTRERSRLRRGASRAGQRHAINNSSDVPLRFSHSSCALATSDGHVRYHA